jgi:hypothetical protein
MKRLCKYSINIIFIFPLLCIVIYILSCGPEENIPRVDFYAVIVSDTHVSRDESKIERLNKLSKMINNGVLPNVEFLINTGDVVSRVYGRRSISEISSTLVFCDGKSRL